MFRRLRYHFETRGARRHGTSIPPADRPWIHPSELPGTFEFASVPPPRPVVARSFQVVVAAMASALLAGGGLLLAVSATAPAGASVGPHVAATIASLPSSDRGAARSMLSIVIYEDQHVGTATAMVLPPGDLAVTTTPIPAGATVEGLGQNNRWMSLTIVGAIRQLGVTVLRLPVSMPVTPLAPLAPSVATGGTPTSLTALAVIPGATSRVQFEYASAYLSAAETPVVVGRSLIVTAQGESLAGVISGTVVVNGAGQAVAASLPTLGENSFVPASFLELLAQRIALGDASDHGWLQLVGADTPSGAALVVSVVEHGDAASVRPGDLIVAIDSVPVNSMADIDSFLYTSSPGERVSLTLQRAGRLTGVDVRLAASP
jgi:putative serine protease PepD